jgi:hypothetical protein
MLQGRENLHRDLRRNLIPPIDLLSEEMHDLGFEDRRPVTASS